MIIKVTYSVDLEIPSQAVAEYLSDETRSLSRQYIDSPESFASDIQLHGVGVRHVSVSYGTSVKESTSKEA